MANQQSATARRARSKRADTKQAGRGTSQNGGGNAAANYEQELAQYLQERIKPGLNRGAIPLLARSIAKEIAHRRPSEDADAAGEPSNEQEYDVRDEVDDEDVRDELDDEGRDEADDDSTDEDEDDVQAEADDDFDDEEDDDVQAEADDDFDDEEDDDVQAEADDDPSDEEDDHDGSLEDELSDLQAKLGDDWILRVSVQGEDAWLTAEKDDGSQHVEAPAADVLADVVKLLNESGGRSS